MPADNSSNPLLKKIAIICTAVLISASSFISLSFSLSTSFKYYFAGGLLIFAFIFITFSIRKVFTVTQMIERFFISTITIAVLFCSSYFILKILSAPFWSWNAVRLVWPLSQIYGFKLYYAPNAGPLLARMYGPVEPLIHSAVAFIKQPTPAVIFGSFISACFYFVPMLWLHFGIRKYGTKNILPILYAFCCFCLLTFASDSLSYAAFVVHTDAPALGLSAMACAALYFRKRKDNILPLMLSSIFAVCAVWAKQTVVPIMIALPVYVLLFDGAKCFRRYIICLGATSIATLLLFFYIYDGRFLFFNMFIIPMSHPHCLGENWIDGLIKAAIYNKYNKGMIIECFPSLAVLIICHFLRNVFLKPQAISQDQTSKKLQTLTIIVALFMIPTSLIGIIKAGGDINTFSPSVYFLACTASLAIMGIVRDFICLPNKLFKNTVKSVLFLIVIVLINVNIKTFVGLAHRINLLSKNYQEVAYQYAKKHPGEIYFPDNVFSNLLAEGKVYHSTDGIFDVKESGFAIGYEHFREYIPSNLKFVAYPDIEHYNWRHKYVLNYLPEFSRQITIKELPGWIVYTREESDR